MRVERINGGFITFVENCIVERVVCKYGENATVIFCNHPPKELKIVECSSYQSQFGTPVSHDGNTLFVSSWEKGLYAYDIPSGKLLWRLKGARMTEISVYPSYLVVLQSDKAIHKIDISDGQLLATIKSGTILRHYKLIDSFVLVNSVRGKLSLLDTKQMEIIKQYSKKIFDPANYPATLLRAELHKNQLIIHGGLDQSIDVNGWTAFQRVIDENLVLLQ